MDVEFNMFCALMLNGIPGEINGTNNIPTLQKVKKSLKEEMPERKQRRRCC
ncbi:hypothetical protein HanIR_Chr03g0149891 [Helianthus annuus]|nr:hypothetical protein HanIR_Chr03g0149891 [Helianthus annuus]